MRRELWSLMTCLCLAVTGGLSACDEGDSTGHGLSQTLDTSGVSEDGSTGEADAGVPSADVVGPTDVTGAPDVPDACPALAPEAPATAPCQLWECVVAPAPECWACALVDAPDASACEAGGETGTCQAGACVVLSDPGQAGPLSVTTSSHELTLVEDGFLPTTASVTLFLPQAAGPFPVVVFHHGFELGADNYTTVGEHLASWGYVAVLPQMPGGLFGGPNHVDLKNYLVTLLDWLEAEESGALEGKGDVAALGLAGHSMGGKISLLTATEDERPLAVFGVDPVDAAGGPIAVDPADYPSVTPELMDQIEVPIVLLGETTNGSSSGGMMGQACAPAEDNFQQYYTHATGPALEIEVIGANHMSFLDNPNCGLLCSVCPAGTDDTDTTRLLMRRYMTAFFGVYLKGDEAYQTYLTGTAMAADVDAGLVLSESKNNL